MKLIEAKSSETSSACQRLPWAGSPGAILFRGDLLGKQASEALSTQEDSQEQSHMDRTLQGKHTPGDTTAPKWGGTWAGLEEMVSVFKTTLFSVCKTETCLFFKIWKYIEEREISRYPSPFQQRERLLTFCPIYPSFFTVLSHTQAHTRTPNLTQGPRSTSWIVTCLTHLYRHRWDSGRRTLRERGLQGRKRGRRDSGATGDSISVPFGWSQKQFSFWDPMAVPSTQATPVSTVSDIFPTKLG